MQSVTEFNERKYLTPDEDERFLRDLSFARPRDFLMLGMLRRYGMRSGELLALRRCDFNEATRQIWVRGSKGSRGRQLTVRPEFFPILLRFCKNLGPEERIFPIKYNRLGEIWRDHRPCKKPLHCLRHTLAIEAYKKSKDIKAVQVILGHRSILSTMVYQDYLFRQSTLDAILL